ncbi:unnamed protein product [Symbiodinium necroappetens]|uniref:Uncharacterized protein n=1 Tax=Symbiodinium necroappetens TaxID=1628268 RepID=A0A812RLM8_9DINO|nr:unnamed protein product [Symbiodinium necroappetens]
MLHLDGSQPEHGARLPADTFSGQSGNCISAAVMRLDTLAQDSDREAQVETLVEASNKFAKRCRWTHIDTRHNMEDHGGVSAAGHQGRISAVAGWLSKAEGALHIMQISCDTRAQRPELQNSEWYLELQRYADSWWTAFLGESRIACRAATSAGACATEPASSGRLSLSRVSRVFSLSNIRLQLQTSRGSGRGRWRRRGGEREGERERERGRGREGEGEGEIAQVRTDISQQIAKSIGIFRRGVLTESPKSSSPETREDGGFRFKPF